MIFSSSLPAPLLVGVAFGWALESAGLGNSNKLMGQFYLDDFTVLKVMLSAILTAMLGLFWLGVFGIVDVSSMYLPPTFLVPQVVGGLVFGIGFVISGLCPGTSCVAAASGRGDGLATIFGLLVGVLLSGFSIPWVEVFFKSTSYGAFTLPQLLHVSYGAIVAVIAIGSVAIFSLIARFESR